MMKFTARMVRSLVEDLAPPRFSDPTAEEFASVVESLESFEAMISALPALERREAVYGVASEREGNLWIPTAHNCLRSVGLALDPEGNCNFAISAHDDEPLVAYHSARTAAAHALYGRTAKFRSKAHISRSDDTPICSGDESLILHVKESGWAVAAARRVDDLPTEILAGISRLSEQGIAHLYFECGGLILAMSGSTRADRRRAMSRVPIVSDVHRIMRKHSGVLVSASETGSHYSEQRDWGLSVASKAGLESENIAAAEMFRASRNGSLAVSESKAERRRISANRCRMRSEYIARRRSGAALVLKTAREIDDARSKSRERHWSEEPSFQRRIEARVRSGRAAYDTARAIYLQRLPTLAHKLLHLLRRAGCPVQEEEFLSRHTKLGGPDVSDPRAETMIALGELAGAGKVRRLRGRASGEVYLMATEKLDARRFGRDLERIVREGAAVSDAAEPVLASDERCIEETGHEVLLDSLEDESAAYEIEAIAEEE